MPLPGDDGTAQPESAAEIHRREINGLPGHDTGDVPPSSDGTGLPF